MIDGMRRRHRPGFSLIEALVVLAIGGMALAIIFSIGMRAGETGFGLGRRAMSAADADLGVSDFRAVIRSLSLRPRELFGLDEDPMLVGTPTNIRAEAVMERATPCAPQGWSGMITLEIVSGPEGAVLRCSTPDTAVTLLTLSDLEAGFEFSPDGRNWSESYQNTRIDGGGDPRSLRLFVRLRQTDADIIESVASGPPASWRRHDGDL